MTVSTQDAVPAAAVDGINYYGRGLRSVGAGDISRFDATTANVNLTNIGNAMETNDWIKVDTDGSYQTEYNGVF